MVLFFLSLIPVHVHHFSTTSHHRFTVVVTIINETILPFLTEEESVQKNVGGGDRFSENYVSFVIPI
jgi:hypothetical protein